MDLIQSPLGSQMPSSRLAVELKWEFAALRSLPPTLVISETQGKGRQTELLIGTWEGREEKEEKGQENGGRKRRERQRPNNSKRRSGLGSVTPLLPKTMQLIWQVTGFLEERGSFLYHHHPQSAWLACSRCSAHAHLFEGVNESPSVLTTPPPCPSDLCLQNEVLEHFIRCLAWPT